jgi:hypothetical protein
MCFLADIYIYTFEYDTKLSVVVHSYEAPLQCAKICGISKGREKISNITE